MREELKFSATRFLDMTGKVYPGQIDLDKVGLTSLEGSPYEVKLGYYCNRNFITDLKGGPTIVGTVFSCNQNKNLVSLEGGPKLIDGNFYAESCPKLKKPKEQIIKYQIKADMYFTDEGIFKYSDIKDEFESYKFNNIKRKGFRTLLGIDK